MIFETDMLDNCSPDLVSRSGVVLLDSKTYTFSNVCAYYIEDLKLFLGDRSNFRLDEDKVKGFTDCVM